MIAGAGLWLAACNTTTAERSRVSEGRTSTPNAYATIAPSSDITGSIPSSRQEPEAAEAQAAANASEAAAKPAEALAPVLPGDEPGAGDLILAEAAESLALGRQQYRASQFREAERQFRRVAQLQPRNAEAWLGVAVCNDRLRNFPEADRAYGKAIAITGPTSEALNNQGYSYILRGDLKRARETLTAAQRQDPNNKFVSNNLLLLDSNERKATR